MISGYPSSYADSRTRFRQAASALGAQQFSYPLEIKGLTDLSIDVAITGSEAQPAVVISSGLHGVESAVGAAVQLAWMDTQRRSPMHGRFILIHALNPYGYATGRRVNEDNVDLNRNFLHPVKAVSELSADPLSESGLSDYARFDALLNPTGPQRRLDGFYVKALGYLAREGRQRLQNAIVTGQYEFEQGLFFGGHQISRSTQWVQDQIRHWVGDASEVCHLDFHTGLGAYAKCQLLVDVTPGSGDHRWCEQTFGVADVVATKSVDSQAYQATGAMGAWLTQHLDDRPYRFLTAEFGTYPALYMLSALREENQAYHFTDPGSAARAQARRRLERSFCPSSPRWRSRVLAQGLYLIEQASRALH